MGNILGAHGRGDQRNIWIITNEGLEEITPIEDTTSAANALARSMGADFYLRRSAQGEEFGWAAYRSTGTARDGPAGQGKWFPTKEAAIMYAAMKGG